MRAMPGARWSTEAGRPRASGPGRRLTCPDLEDEVGDGREGEVRAVAEDDVASTGQLHQASGLGRQSAGQFLDYGRRADRVVLADQDQDGAPDGAEQAPGIEARDLVLVVVRGDVRVPDHPGQEPAGLLGPARRGAVKRVADAGEVSLEILGVRRVTVPAVG